MPEPFQPSPSHVVLCHCEMFALVRLDDVVLCHLLSLTVPLVKPNDVAVRLESITATTAEITWTSVDTSPEMVRGFFRGYRVSLSRFNKITVQATAQMAADNEAVGISRVHMYQSLKCNVNDSKH